MRYFVTGHEMLLYLSGDREEHKEECCFELPDFESKEEAVAAAREFIKEHKNAVNDQKHGIGSVTYWTAEVTRCIEDEDFGWLPCDADGATEDGHGLVPADATADHIGYEWTGRAHGSLADALATLAVQRWLEQWLVAE